MKLYFREAESPAVADYIKSLQSAVPFSHLHELELKNTLRIKIFRKEARRGQVRASIRLMDEDLASGILERPRLSWPEVFRKAEELSGKFSPRMCCRTLDLLHLASAALLGIEQFLTFDNRQAKLASKSGLQVIRT